MWISLVQGKEDNAENVIDQACLENATIPPVQPEWLNSTELRKRKSDQVSEEVNRMLREEQNLNAQDNATVCQNWDKSVSSTDLCLKCKTPAYLME